MIRSLLSRLGIGAGGEQAADSTPSNITAPYSGARITKLNNHWMPSHYSGDQAIRESWSLLTARIRDRVRNDSVLQKAKLQLSRLVVGTGIDAFSDAAELSEGDDEELIKYEVESDTWFERWCMHEADAEGENTFWDQQRIAFEDEVEAGNALWLEVIDDTPGRTVPLCYQLLEYEQVDQTRDRDAGFIRKTGERYNRISNGIEYDARGRKVAFWIYDAHPYDNSTGWTSESTRIPASRVIHQYYPSRPSAKLGISWFAAPMQNNHDLDRYVANELTTRGLMALMGVAVKSNDHNFADGLSAEDDDTGIPNFKLGYPYIGNLKKDDEVEVIESGRNGSDATALINLLLNLQAMGCKLSLNRLLGDPSRANLASIKASHHDDDAMVAPIQEAIALKVIQRIRIAHTRWAVARGLFRSISARDYERKPWQYNTFSVIASKRTDLDKDDGEAAIDRLRAGLSTYQDECARRGRHWRRNLLRMKTVNDISREYGVCLDWTKGNGGQLVATSSDAKAKTESLESQQQNQGSSNDEP